MYGLSLDADWFYKAASYYDNAIFELRAYLSRLAGSTVGPNLKDASDDSILAAVSLFSVYESIDSPRWSQYVYLTPSLTT